MPEKELAHRLREAICLCGYSIRTEKADLNWCERYVRFHNVRHPSTMQTNLCTKTDRLPKYVSVPVRGGPELPLVGLSIISTGMSRSFPRA